MRRREALLWPTETLLSSPRLAQVRAQSGTFAEHSQLARSSRVRGVAHK